jgi:hypothetical protein
MNNPEYILTDEMEAIIAAVKKALDLSVLNYQYGYVEELNETLKQWEEAPDKYTGKFPLVWLAEPFTITRGDYRKYGTADVDLFVINTTDKTWKAAERMANNYNNILFPIYREILKQVSIRPAFSHNTENKMSHRLVKGYYWSEAKQSVLNDIVDCLKISGLRLEISHNKNCITI